MMTAAVLAILTVAFVSIQISCSVCLRSRDHATNSRTACWGVVFGGIAGVSSSLAMLWLLIQRHRRRKELRYDQTSRGADTERLTRRRGAKKKLM